MSREREKSRQRRGHQEADIPTGSFADIAFLLIIFFFVATSLIQLQGFTTDIPSGEKSEQTEQQETTPTIQIQDTQLLFNDAKISLRNLRRKLFGLNLDEAEGEDKVVLLEATGTVPYQLYYDVMAAISKAGGMVGIITVEEE